MPKFGSLSQIWIKLKFRFFLRKKKTSSGKLHSQKIVINPEPPLNTCLVTPIDIVLSHPLLTHDNHIVSVFSLKQP